MELSLTDITQAVGIIGFIFYMLSYFLLLFGKLKGTDNTYILMNMVAASCVLFSLMNHFNLASALIQIFWIVVSIAGLVRYNFAVKTTSKQTLRADTI